MDAKLKKAYEAGSRILQEELTPEDRTLLNGEAGDVVVVRGAHDRVEDVLSIAGVPHRVVDAGEVATLRLDPEQMLAVNCPGNLDAGGIAAVRDFVERGGTLFTTDWALKHLVERAFPGRIAHNGGRTGDEVVAVRVHPGADHALLAGLEHADADPVWWLEGASFPIRILDEPGVTILLDSPELGARYGDAPVAVTFDHGRGSVIHAISHYYLQRAEVRGRRHSRSWKEYASEMGAYGAAAAKLPDMDGLLAGEVEAAHKSLRFLTNAVLEKKRRAGSRRPGAGTTSGLRYPLRSVGGHLIAEIGGELALIDTGSPCTLGRGGPLLIGGTTHDAQAGGDLLGWISARVGAAVDYLVGMDVLGGYRALFDVRAGFMALDARPISGGAMRISSAVGGLPMIDVTMNGSTHSAVLDTGAHLSYLPLPAAAAESRETQQDFLPGFGDFTTPVHEVEAVIGSTTIRLRSGVLPGELAGVLSAFGIASIVGSRLFIEKRVELDFPAETVRIADARGSER